MIVQLEGQLKEKKENEDALKSENENLKAEVVEKLALQTHIKELEEQLAAAEARLREEVLLTIMGIKKKPQNQLLMFV